MISLMLQAIRSLMPSKLCSRSQQLKLKKVFLHDWGKPMANLFTNNRVWVILGHTFRCQTLLLNLLPQKVASVLFNLGREKTRIFRRRNATFELKPIIAFFSHSSNAVLKLIRQVHWVFGTTVWQGTMSCLLHLRCQYKCPSSRRRAIFPKRNLGLFVSHFWGLIFFNLRSTS